MTEALPKSDSRAPEDRHRRLPSHLYVVVAGLLLGVLSFVGDALPGLAGDVVIAAVSTGSAWCLLSLIAGYQYTKLLRSMLGAVTLLLIATLTYYVLTAVSGQRFGGYTPSQSGPGSALTPAGWQAGIASMLRGVVFWCAASLAAGVVMGSLGYLIRSGKRVHATISIGLAFGIIAAPGISSAITVLRYGLNDTTSQNVLPAICQLTLAGMSLVWAVLTARAKISWPLLSGVALGTCVTVTLLWEAVDAVRNRL